MTVALNESRHGAREIVSTMKNALSLPRAKTGRDPFEVLVYTMISQRTKDEVTDAVSRRLLSRFRTPRALSTASVSEIARLLKPCGFYRQKAKNLKKTAGIIVKKFGGKVPRKMDDLLSLPGVGQKTADCVSCFAFGEGVIAVDVHVEVISKRLGFAESRMKPSQVREMLHSVFPERAVRLTVNKLFVEFGKKYCRTRNPICVSCPVGLRGLCPSRISFLSERVLRIVSRIPKGKVATYSGIARRLGDPALARLVGLVLSRNKDTERIPCYRVVHGDGRLGGYALGVREKMRRLVADGVCLDVKRLRVCDIKRINWTK